MMKQIGMTVLLLFLAGGSVVDAAPNNLRTPAKEKLANLIASRESQDTWCGSFRQGIGPWIDPFGQGIGPWIDPAGIEIDIGPLIDPFGAKASIGPLVDPAGWLSK